MRRIVTITAEGVSVNVYPSLDGPDQIILYTLPAPNSRIDTTEVSIQAYSSETRQFTAIPLGSVADLITRMTAPWAPVALARG